MLSMNSLNSAMMSFSTMKTISSVKNQLQGRSNVLKAELQSVSGAGNVEAKEERLAENEEKVQQVTDQLNENLGKINHELNRPQTAEEKEKALEEKRAEEKETQKAEQEKVEKEQTTDANQNVASAIDSTPAGADTVEIHMKADGKPAVAIDLNLTYNAAGVASPDGISASAGQAIDVSA